MFFFDAAGMTEAMQHITPIDRAQTIAAAEQVCQNIFQLRGAEPHQFQDRIDWNYSPADHVDWRWDLNRHVFFETLGRAFWYTNNERYAVKFRDLLCDWLAANPATIDQPNWDSVFEVAFRSTVWVWALYYFRGARAFDAELCQRLLVGFCLTPVISTPTWNSMFPITICSWKLKRLHFWHCAPPSSVNHGAGVNEGSGFWSARCWSRCVRTRGRRAEHLYHRVIAGELLELLVLMENNRCPHLPSSSAIPKDGRVRAGTCPT